MFCHRSSWRSAQTSRALVEDKAIVWLADKDGRFIGAGKQRQWQFYGEGGKNFKMTPAFAFRKVP